MRNFKFYKNHQKNFEKIEIDYFNSKPSILCSIQYIIIDEKSWRYRTEGSERWKGVALTLCYVK